jgi:hypothetical protein
MDWGRFGVRVPQADIPKLGGMLEDLAKDKSKIEDMQVGRDLPVCVCTATAMYSALCICSRGCVWLCCKAVGKPHACSRQGCRASHIML